MSEIQNTFLEMLYENNYDTPDYILDESEWEEFTDQLSFTPTEAF